jgi:hypothetical protein
MATKVPTKSRPKTRPTAKPKPKQGAKTDKMPKARPSGGSRSKGKVMLRRPAPPLFIPRAMAAIDDDDVLMAHGAGGGVGYGRCGGRLLGSKLEQTICDRLGASGVAHSHSPRHFEVRLEGVQVAAYAPMVVLRGRGREGKSVVIESADDLESPILKKVVAFRSQYGQEFYVIFVAPDEVLDEVPLAAYDEACSAVNVNTLISRLAE